MVNCNLVPRSELQNAREQRGAQDSTTACHDLIAAANERGTFDNLSAAVVRVVRPTPERPEPTGIGAAPRRVLRR
jgi:serine/threonine protein phosphatase PrpC